MTRVHPRQPSATTQRPSRRGREAFPTVSGHLLAPPQSYIPLFLKANPSQEPLPPTSQSLRPTLLKKVEISTGK